jgi:hypothetical protein
MNIAPYVPSRWGETPVTGPLAGIPISRDPMIFWGPGANEYPLGLGSKIAERLGNRRAYFFISPSWHREDAQSVAGDLALVRAAQARHPEHRFLFLVSTRSELNNYRKVGLPAAVCIKTAFVDETVFDILPESKKRFAAIYNAAMAPYKRHELCSEVEDLGLLYYRHEYFLKHEADHVARVLRLLARATFINELDGNYRQLLSTEVPAWLNQARVGLCLSPQEGSMRASIEYLYCGLPVVSTPNIGGRNRLSDPAYWIEAEPTAPAVAAAVRTLLARNIDPKIVRQGAIEKIRPDRIRLINLIAAIFAEEGVRFPKDADWTQLFRRGTWPFKTEEMLFSETPVAETRAP